MAMHFKKWPSQVSSRSTAYRMNDEARTISLSLGVIESPYSFAYDDALHVAKFKQQSIDGPGLSLSGAAAAAASLPLLARFISGVLVYSTVPDDNYLMHLMLGYRILKFA